MKKISDETFSLSYGELYNIANILQHVQLEEKSRFGWEIETVKEFYSDLVKVRDEIFKVLFELEGD